MGRACTSCNAKMDGFLGAAPSADNPDMCAPCGLKLRISRESESADQVEGSTAWERASIDSIRLTTAFTVAGAEVEMELDIVTAECAFGMNVIRDMFAGMRDIVGGRSEATQKVLRDARKTCLAELKKEAAAVGADAVIGVDLDYSELSGSGKSMLFLVASGTAVKLKA
jgi:uncharacterized protein YbjQ (UPF0145 family)